MAPPMIDPHEAARLTRFLGVLRRQHRQPEVMSGFFAGVGAAGVVAALSTVAFGPRREDVAGWDGLPELLRRGLLAAARWPTFDAEGFCSDLAALLEDDDPDVRATVSAATAFLLTSGDYDSRLLAAWSRAHDRLTLPRDGVLTWGSFLVGADGPQPWAGLAGEARGHASADDRAS